MATPDEFRFDPLNATPTAGSAFGSGHSAATGIPSAAAAATTAVAKAATVAVANPIMFLMPRARPRSGEAGRKRFEQPSLGRWICSDITRWAAAPKQRPVTQRGTPLLGSKKYFVHTMDEFLNQRVEVLYGDSRFSGVISDVAVDTNSLTLAQGIVATTSIHGGGL